MKLILSLILIGFIPYVNAAYPSNETTYPVEVFWGDTHLHTSFSVDANGMGNRNLTPDDAYRFAKGESVTAHNGQTARLHRPLDFLVVADHAVNLGVMPKLAMEDSGLLKTELGKRVAPLFSEEPTGYQQTANR